MKQNQKIVSLIGTVFLVFIVLLVFVYMGNSRQMDAGIEKSGPVANAPISEEQVNQEQPGNEEFLSDSGLAKENQGEVFDGILSKKKDNIVVIKKDDNGEELEFQITQDTKITLLELSLKDDAKKNTEFKGSDSIALSEIAEGDNLSVVAMKLEEGGNLYLASEVKKVVLSLDEK